jgi:hypothetical protein
LKNSLLRATGMCRIEIKHIKGLISEQGANLFRAEAG